MIDWFVIQTGYSSYIGFNCNICTSSYTNKTHRVALFTKLQIFRQPQISFHLRKINKCVPKFVSFVHAHINRLDIELFDVSLTCVVCYLSDGQIGNVIHIIL